MKRSGFTMIELIFVIVILGILAAVAIPKLAATRNDATASTVATSIASCINEQGSLYMKNGAFSADAAAIAASSGSCKAAITTNTCYTVSGDSTTGKLTVTGTKAPTLDATGVSTDTDVCGKAIALTDKNGLSNGATAVVHQF